jgi:hypothetical protein
VSSGAGTQTIAGSAAGDAEVTITIASSQGQNNNRQGQN